MNVIPSATNPSTRTTIHYRADGHDHRIQAPEELQQLFAPAMDLRDQLSMRRQIMDPLLILRFDLAQNLKDLLHFYVPRDRKRVLW